MLNTTHQIRDLAYHLWEARGRPAGRDLEHWLEAERLLDAESTAAHRAEDPAPSKAKVKGVQKKAKDDGGSKRAKSKRQTSQ